MSKYFPSIIFMSYCRLPPQIINFVSIKVGILLHKIKILETFLNTNDLIIRLWRAIFNMEYMFGKLSTIQKKILTIAHNFNTLYPTDSHLLRKRFVIIFGFQENFSCTQQYNINMIQQLPYA